MGPNDVVRAPSPGPEEEPTEWASLEIRVIRAGSELGFGLKLPGEDGTGLVSACIAVGGPAVTLPAAHVAGLGVQLGLGLGRRAAGARWRPGHQVTSAPPLAVSGVGRPRAACPWPAVPRCRGAGVRTVPIRCPGEHVGIVQRRC